MSDLIRRSFNVEMRTVDNQDSDSDKMIVEGYALRFDEETVIGQAPWG